MTNRRIALTGGIACGKSLVAKFLNELGVETIDADDIVHELISDPAERKRLAAEVFADEAKRRALEAKLHPIVKARIAAWLSTVPDASRVAVVGKRVGWTCPLAKPPEGADRRGVPATRDASDTVFRLAIIPLLFEVHWEDNFDIICCVTSERETQVSRMMTTRGYTREEAEARLKAQMPVEEKAAKSHYVIDNDGSAEELKSKVAAFVGWLNTVPAASRRVAR